MPFKKKKGEQNLIVKELTSSEKNRANGEEKSFWAKAKEKKRKI